MPRVRLLPIALVLGICAVVAVPSVLAVGGSAPIVHHSAPDANNTSGGADQALSAQEQETDEAGENGQGGDKVAQAIADEFGVSKDDVLVRHQEGIGFGALFKLYKLARAKGISVDELLATIPTGPNGEREFGFGHLRKSLTAEQIAAFNSGPKNLGQLVSGKNKQAKSKAQGAPDGSGSAQPNPSGKVPPGQAKKAARAQQAAQ